MKNSSRSLSAALLVGERHFRSATSRGSAPTGHSTSSATASSAEHSASTTSATDALRFPASRVVGVVEPGILAAVLVADELAHRQPGRTCRRTRPRKFLQRPVAPHGDGLEAACALSTSRCRPAAHCLPSGYYYSPSALVTVFTNFRPSRGTAGSFPVPVADDSTLTTLGSTGSPPMRDGDQVPPPLALTPESLSLRAIAPLFAPRRGHVE